MKELKKENPFTPDGKLKDGYTKCEIKVMKIFSPKNKLDITPSDFVIASCCLGRASSNFEGKALNYNYKNQFTIKGFSPIGFSQNDLLTAILKQGKVEVYKGKEQLGNYDIVQLHDIVPPHSDEGKKHFLEKVLGKTATSNLYENHVDPFILLKEKNVDELMKCKGVGEKTALSLIKKYESKYEYADIFARLHKYDLSISICKKLLDKYDSVDNVEKIIKSNPYQFSEVVGLGFIKCDEIAIKGGMAKNCDKRLKAFILHLLEEKGAEGNSWVKDTFLKNEVNQYFQEIFNSKDIETSLLALDFSGVVAQNEKKDKICLVKYRDMEQEICDYLLAYNDMKNDDIIRKPRLEALIIEGVENEQGYQFSDEQIKEFRNIMDNKVSMLIGGAGVGKTSMIRLLASVYEGYGKKVCLTSFSAKASSRILENTGFEGKTIHRVLGYKDGGFLHGQKQPIPYDVIIIDESSFLGGSLLLSLLRALPSHIRIILVGDDAQLPSVSECNVFYDIQHSGVFYVGRLTKIQRQAQDSGIIDISLKVRQGMSIFPRGWTGNKVIGKRKDMKLDIYDKDDRDLGIPTLLGYYEYFVENLEQAKDTQVVLAMRDRGEVCTSDINLLIQERLNPFVSQDKEVLIKKNKCDMSFRLHDRVMNTRNDYNMPCYDSSKDIDWHFQDDLESSGDKPEKVPCFNGFSGEIIKILNRNTLVIKFDLIDNPIIFDRSTLGRLDLSYAITVHKAQGSEWNNVIVLIDNTSYIMNNKELIYTAITRASDRCVLCGEAKAISSSIIKSATKGKQTFLKQFLKKG